MEKQKLLNETEMAEYLRWSRQTLANKRWIGEGPPYIKLSSRCVRYDLAAVEEWVRSCAVAPGQRTV